MYDDYDYDYDGPPRQRRPKYKCGGWANYSGPCGASDCASCYPSTWHLDEDEEPDEAEHTGTLYTPTEEEPHGC